KTNLSEWANFRSSHSISGWSGRGGQTRNPYALDRNPCGSSSGSGAATAASLCAASIGTETDGSIVCPSNANSLVGLKPTVGLVSRAGIIPISASQDTAGPMARTVADAAILMTAITGVDPRDPVTAGSRSRSGIDYAKYLDAPGVKGARIGVARDYFGFNARVDRLLEEALAVMKGLGAVLIDPVHEPTKGRYDAAELEVLLYEFKDGLNAYLRTISPSIGMKTIDDVIRFNEQNREREMPWFGQETMISAAGKGSLTSPEYLRALAKCRTLSRRYGIDAMLRKDRLDAIIAPTGGPAWKTDRLNGDHFSGGFSTAAAVAGYPHITVPAGYIEGVPVGLSIFAGPWMEGRLLRYAAAFEQATRHRKAPQYLQVS
ncbi:MAG: amidase, partial [Acidobacteriota bacterium]